ncbi:MAG: 3-dehydroquinate synthase [Actinomycetota bacterium]
MKLFLAKSSHAHKKTLILAPAAIVELADLAKFCSETGSFLFVTPDGEDQKKIDVVEKIWLLLGEKEFGRTDAIIGIGGGATTDLAGFVAATWLRGIAWYAIPTTLAGMVDASVGGKTGINTSAGKNLVGSFYSPKQVCADISWLTSLSNRDFSAGLAEVIKTGFIRDLSILTLLESTSGVSEARVISAELVTKSVTVKADVVSSDFKEGKLREILNFGHTFGHAIEKQSNYSLRHGEAVSIGLHYAALLSEETLGMNREVTTRLLRLLQKFDLPLFISAEEFPWNDIYALMSGDKKSRDGHIRFIGLLTEGEPTWIEETNSEMLRRTYERILQ